MIEVPNHPAIPRKNLGILDLHFLFLARLDGEDPHLEKALAGIFHLPKPVAHKYPKGKQNEKDDALHIGSAESLLSAGRNNQLLTDL